jgi:hypothetical protein
VTTRAGALRANRSRSRLVSRNDARWLSAKVRSRPSAVICPGKSLEHLVGDPPHLRLGRHVRDEHVHLPAAGRTDLASRIFGAVVVPANDREVRPHLGQAHGGRPADASCATGDQHRPAGHRPALSLIHVGAPRGGDKIAMTSCSPFTEVDSGSPRNATRAGDCDVAQMVMATFPRAFPASRCRMASGTRSSE